MAHSIHFGGTLASPTGAGLIDLSGATYGLTVVEHESNLTPTFYSDVQSVPYGFAGISWGPHYKPRSFTIPCRVKATSLANLKTQISAVFGVLNVTGLRSLKLDEWSDRFWFVRTQPPGPIRWIGDQVAAFDLSFEAPDPRAYSTTETTQTVNLIAGSNNFNVTASGAVSGTAEVDPVYVLKTMSAGASALSLSNNTRTEAVTCASGTSFTSSDWVRIDATTRAIIESSTDSGSNWTDRRSYLSAAHIFPKLTPGVQNAFTMAGLTGTGVLEITYRARYL